MSLYEMLTDKRSTIIEKCRVSMVETMGLPTLHEFDDGLSVMYDQLVEVVKVSLEKDSTDTRQRSVADKISAEASRGHAQDSHSRGYTISQLVRGYGSICQGVTEFALETGEKITPAEFAQLNLSLDVAIAQAVTEFQHLSLGTVKKEEKLKMGFLVHELRNSLSSALLSHELIRMGLVANSGATSRIITNSLTQMRDLIDRSVAEVRMSTTQDVELSVFKLLGLISEVESSLAIEANVKSVAVFVEAEQSFEVEADRHLMISAVTNLVQNAIKFSKVKGSVWIRAFAEGQEAVIEIEDRSGGLAEDKVEDLFKPYTQAGSDRSGLGLGLSIAKSAVELNNGVLSVRNMPEVGCIFSIRMPIHADESVPARTSIATDASLT